MTSSLRRSDGSDAYFDPVFALVTRHVMTLHNPTCIAISTEREGKREKRQFILQTPHPMSELKEEPVDASPLVQNHSAGGAGKV